MEAFFCYFGWHLILGIVLTITVCLLGVDFSELCFPLRIRKYPRTKMDIFWFLLYLLLECLIDTCGLGYWIICVGT